MFVIAQSRKEIGPDTVKFAAMKVLVTGGAGYIGSHVVRQLGEVGHDVVVLDNLSTGHKWAVLSGRLVKADLGDLGAVEQVLAATSFDAVQHFAASIVVPESVSEPLKYYRNNTVNLLNLLELCVRYRVRRFIFSSTAAVYGLPEAGKVLEQTPLAPISPYGWSKAMSERILLDTAMAVGAEAPPTAVTNSARAGLRYVILRYFNVAGSDPQLRIGQASKNATHLIKVACETALGQRPEMPIYGTDYPTRDGTCIRDYIHVEDLAQAHLAALDYLDGGGESQILNCGYGHGHTVREVIEAVRRASGKAVPARETARRPGDPVELVADNTRIRRVLGWTPRYDDLDFIVKTAWEWEMKMRGRVGGSVQ
jgi:UDP-glucose 4-epimerase